MGKKAIVIEVPVELKTGAEERAPFFDYLWGPEFWKDPNGEEKSYCSVSWDILGVYLARYFEYECKTEMREHDGECYGTALLVLDHAEEVDLLQYLQDNGVEHKIRYLKGPKA